MRLGVAAIKRSGCRPIRPRIAALAGQVPPGRGVIWIVAACRGVPATRAVVGSASTANNSRFSGHGGDVPGPRPVPMWAPQALARRSVQRAGAQHHTQQACAVATFRSAGR